LNGRVQSGGFLYFNPIERGILDRLDDNTPLPSMGDSEIGNLGDVREFKL